MGGGHIFFRYMLGHNSVHKKCLSICVRVRVCVEGGEEGFAPPPPETLITYTFSVYVLSHTYKNFGFPLLQQAKEFIIFFSGCLNLSANLFIGTMVLVRNVQEPLIASLLKGLPSFLLLCCKGP